MPELIVFWHLTELANYDRIMDQQWQLMQKSGLYDAADEIYLCGNGQPWTFENWLKNNGKAKMGFQQCANDGSLREYPTLRFLQMAAKSQSEPFYILYIHLKGLTRFGDPCNDDWRDFLNWAVIEQYQHCVDKLTDHDIVGANWETNPWPHFSGNFWWARSDYITKLPELYHPVDCMYRNITQFKTHVDGGAPYWRYDHEAWIGSGQPRVWEIAKSFPVGAQHYHSRYSREKYQLTV